MSASYRSVLKDLGGAGVVLDGSVRPGPWHLARGSLMLVESKTRLWKREMILATGIDV